MSRTAPDICLDAFRAAQDATPHRTRTIPMPVDHQQSLLDTDLMILRKWIDPEEPPAEMAITQ